MKTILFNKKLVKVYDSIDEMPIVNFQKYNKFLLIDSGIGSDADSVDAHVVKIAKYINQGDSKKALQELQNMRQNMYMINSEISPKYLAFAALVHSIDGVENKDMSDSGLRTLLSDLKMIKHSKIANYLAKLKKKVTTELELYFPEDFDNPKEKEAYDKLKTRVLLIVDSIIGDNDNSKEIETIDRYMLGLNKPKIFTGVNSVEIKYDKQFENACLFISQKTNTDAKKMTVLQFYNALNTLKKQVEAESKSLKKHKK